MGAAGLSAYSASKHALRGLCDCLRLEVREGEREREKGKKRELCFFPFLRVVERFSLSTLELPLTREKNGKKKLKIFLFPS